MTDTRASNISNVSRSLSARAKMHSRARNVCKIPSFSALHLIGTGFAVEMLFISFRIAPSSLAVAHMQLHTTCSMHRAHGD